MSMDKIVMYMHGGSENHGCEAIVRSTTALIGVPAVLYSRVPAMDIRYHLDEICEVRSRCTEITRYTPQWLVRQVRRRILHDQLAFVRHNYQNVIEQADQSALYLSIGGDNYCGDLVRALQYTNQQLNARNVKTVLWGCSIDPSYMEKAENVADLKRYALIFARERITYDALIAAGLEKTARLSSDPAFTLGQEAIPLPELFGKRKMIGVNISPYVQKNGAVNLVYDNYRRMIQQIIERTEYGVVLIPHVVWSESDDRIPCQKLLDDFRDTGRVVMLGDYNCCQLKYCIARCEMLVTARTHASIAAYSTNVPTIVVGYSMKSKGLAEDLFGTAEHYVVNAWDMKTDGVLADAFSWLDAEKENVRNHLSEIMPGYIQRVRDASAEIQQLMKVN